MSLVGDFALPAEGFVLTHTLRELPAVRVEFERVVAGGDPLPCLAVRGEPTPEFLEAALEDPTVEDVTVRDDVEDGLLCSVDWRDLDEGLLGGIVDLDPVLLGASGHDDTWEVTVRFSNRRSLARFRDQSEALGVRVALRRLYQTAGPTPGRYGLTPGQREALSAALEMGLFEVPRATTLSEVADELGVSTNALSERLRRGHANLIESALAAAAGP